MAYKNSRLLVEAVNREMENLRKFVMAQEPSAALDSLQDAVTDLRKLVGELGEMAARPTVDDVAAFKPADYVATMKPLVRNYHRQLLSSGNLAPCLCEDLQATGILMVLIGDGKTVVRTAHDPNRPEAALAIESMMESLDSGTKRFAGEAVEALENVAATNGPPDGNDPEPA